MDMTEIERENILAQRQEEIQRIQDKRNLDQMLRDRSGAGDDTVSSAAKRRCELSKDVTGSLKAVQVNMLNVELPRRSPGSLTS